MEPRVSRPALYGPHSTPSSKQLKPGVGLPFVSRVLTGIAAAGILGVALTGSIAWSAPGAGSNDSSVPAITAVLNNYSYILPGPVNYGIAPGSIFVIFGSGMATPGVQAVLQDSTKGLPLKLNGASLTVTVAGNTVYPAFYYATATQIAAALPSNTPLGNATMTVTYNGIASVPATFPVVRSALGIASMSGDGTGPVMATDANYNFISPTNSAAAGQIITLWGTGLGAGPADSDTTYTPTPHQSTHPEAARLDVAGGCAVFVGAASPLSHAVGIGLNGPVSGLEIDRLEAFYRSRGGKSSLVICPLAEAGEVGTLGDRGYRVTEFNNVLVKRLAGVTIVLTPRVRRALPDETDVWSHTVGRGFFEEHELTTEEMDVGRAICAMSGALCYRSEERRVGKECRSRWSPYH